MFNFNQIILFQYIPTSYTYINHFTATATKKYQLQHSRCYSALGAVAHSQVSTARRADESVGGHVGVGGAAHLALEALLVVGESSELAQRLEELLLLLLPARHVGEAPRV